MEKINQIPFAYHTGEEIKKVVEKLSSIGYKLFHGLDNIDVDNPRIVAVVIDTRKKEVWTTNVTCMVCWCAGKRRPLYAEEILEFFDELIIKRDLDFYNNLLETRANCDPNRPGGVIVPIRSK